MKKQTFSQFENLKKQENLIHGVCGKDFGNLSLEYGSKKEVSDNEKKIAQALAIDRRSFYSVKQVHGTKIKIIKSKKAKQGEEEADGLITDQKNIFLMVKTADCLPVLFFDPVKKVVAAVHVGWRGAIEKIFLTSLIKMINSFNCQLKNILACIGPGIGVCCFKHKNLIQSKLPEWKDFIKEEKNGWQSADIKGFIKSQLIDVGIKEKNIETMNVCTNCSKEFFSHFRCMQTGEKEGRFATIIGLR